MKEKLYTIPLNDAVNTEDECPFCYIERNLERDAIEFTLGSSLASYMESDTREKTDNEGFCRHHLKMLYDYGNRHGYGLILKTHFNKQSAEIEKAFSKIKAPKWGKHNHNAVTEFISGMEKKCFVCEYYETTYRRYIDTFFFQYRKDEEFRKKIAHSKGFCFHHLGELMAAAEKEMPKSELEAFFLMLEELTVRNDKRISEDISWFCDKFDHRNVNADWKNSRDAVQRTAQKLKGGYPAEAPYSPTK